MKKKKQFPPHPRANREVLFRNLFTGWERLTPRQIRFMKWAVPICFVIAIIIWFYRVLLIPFI